ncbi:MAG: tetratricopeptide repeat protein [Bryobacterales bacterium]|nr:tetratricopeptide repeat protein [Bryobacterales bacterium]
MPEEQQRPAMDVLDSWKEIAEHLGRDVRTAMRWERSRGLPVHRLPGGRKAAVYALRSELEQWRGKAHKRDGEGNGAAAPGRPSVAVLPFSSLSADKENEYFSDGLADEIITYLAGVHGLRVTARTSSFAFRGKEEDVRGIGAKLGVEALLEGSVQRSGGRIRVSAQLVSCRDGCHLWCERYDRELTDIFDVQEQIAVAIAAALKLTVAPRAALGRKPPNLEAYQLWLKGRHHQLSKRSVQEVVQAGEYFAQAAALDDEFAAAHLAVGQHLLNLAVLGFVAPNMALQRGRPEIERALELDGRLGEAHAARGVFLAWFDFDWAGAQLAFERAAVCEPGSPVIHRLRALTLLAPLGRLEEAEREARRALELDPICPESHFLLALMLFFRREYEQAEASIRTTVELGAANPQTLWVSGLVAASRGKFGEAIAQCERAVALYGHAPMVAAHLGMLYGMAGRTEEARRALEQIGRASRESYVSPIYPALVHMALGETDAAFTWLERAVEGRDPHILHLPVKPIYDSLRGDARFGALLRKMGLASPPPTA